MPTIDQWHGYKVRHIEVDGALWQRRIDPSHYYSCSGAGTTDFFSDGERKTVSYILLPVSHQDTLRDVLRLIKEAGCNRPDRPASETILRSFPHPYPNPEHDPENGDDHTRVWGVCGKLTQDWRIHGADRTIGVINKDRHGIRLYYEDIDEALSEDKFVKHLIIAVVPPTS